MRQALHGIAATCGCGVASAISRAAWHCKSGIGGACMTLQSVGLHDIVISFVGGGCMTLQSVGLYDIVISFVGGGCMTFQSVGLYDIVINFVGGGCMGWAV